MHVDGLDPPNEGNRRASVSETHPTLLSYEELWDLGIKYSKEHLRRLETDGLFPERVPLSAARVAWVEAEIIQWINDRISTRSGRLGERTD
ncbi:AlpA family phage regulatory protein [Ruegeria sp. HKCCD7318]|nr:AlpA family phage regulatory protein [Ruegeria sp. HKCCD7318]